jgi:hypothetical protein
MAFAPLQRTISGASVGPTLRRHREPRSQRTVSPPCSCTLRVIPWQLEPTQSGIAIESHARSGRPLYVLVSLCRVTMGARVDSALHCWWEPCIPRARSQLCSGTCKVRPYQLEPIQQHNVSQSDTLRSLYLRSARYPLA